jgi:hypothetical protein
MPERCWFAALPDAGPCEGRLVRCHLIPQQLIRREVRTLAALRDPRGEIPVRLRAIDPRCWVYGCGGAMGPGGHHGRFKPDGPLPIPRRLLPAGLEKFAAELGLGWWLDRTYGEVT